MSNINLFARYTEAKMQRFRQWLQTSHGKQVYSLFRKFAERWRDAGHDRCSACLIVQRLRWECGIVGKYNGYKISNDHAPMLARQLVQDHPEYAGFFAFHEDNTDHEDMPDHA